MKRFLALSLLALALALGATQLVGAAAARSYSCLGETATKVGTTGANTITGTAGDDVIVGLGGNDTINGGGGNDLICGGAGADTIKGGIGGDRLMGDGSSDILYGQAGADSLNGGQGADDCSGGGGSNTLVSCNESPSPGPGPEPDPDPDPQSSCDPNYAGGCVPVASDVDCAGGSGNGPRYIDEQVRVVGSDIYGLDTDDDRIGCDSLRVGTP